MWKPWVVVCLLWAGLRAQTQPAPISLQDAIQGARKYGGQVQSAHLAAQIAHQDTVQARAGLLPTLSAFNQYVYTEGNGTPSGVFVANDGVHVYNEQAQVHEDLFNAFRRADLRRAKAAEAVAAAKRDVALRGLDATVVQDFYAVVTAARKVTNARTSLADADKFLDITEKQERGGEAAKADVIKARLQQQQRRRDLVDAQVAYEKSKVTLAVLIFPDITRDFTAVDDLESPPSLAEFPAVEAEAARSSPDVRAAQAGIQEARQEVSVARYQYLPSLSLDFAYGIDANQFAAKSSGEVPESGRSTLPDYLVDNRQNLGYSGEVTLNIPLWNWGATRSKVAQAKLHEEQAKVDLSVAQKQLRANITSYYLEAKAAQEQIESLRDGVNLSVESLRLTLLRYQAGEAAVLEVADAQTTLAGARNMYADGLARYRVALANLQTLTGHF
jgi:outer membrane protein TolC